MKVQNIRDAHVYSREYGDLQLLCGNTTSEMRTQHADLKIIRIRPGLQTSHHFHLERESIFHITAGQIVVTSVRYELSRQLTAGDTVVLEPGEDHVFRNVGATDAVMFEIESPPHSSADKILWEKDTGNIRITPKLSSRFWNFDERVKLKICGVKTLDAALECFAIGVDAIGIHAIERQGILETLRESAWIARLPEELSIFLLTDATESRTLEQIIARTKCDTLQIQGPKSPDDLARISDLAKQAGCKVVRTVSAGSERSKQDLLEEVVLVSEHADAILMDASTYGGKGKLHNWELTKSARGQIKIPLIVAGGIGVDNCSMAIEELRPYALDVESKSEWHIPLPDGGRVSAKNFGVIRQLVDCVRSKIGGSA
jgi:phosphoribosylanthranilate isomerase